MSRGKATSTTSTSDEEDEAKPMVEAATILATAASSGQQQSDDADDSVKSKDTPLPEFPKKTGTGVGPLSESITHERRWEIMFERLKAYKRKHGNCLVPNRYPLDTQLGSWVSAQRRQYKIVTGGGTESAAMTPERAKKLRDIGFEWSTTNPRNVPWEARYKELEEFVACYGHAEVPMRWEENPQLSNWVSKQRHQYKLMQSNRASRLNMDKVNKLNKIGFVWEASRRRLGDGGIDEEEDESDSDNAGAQKRPSRPSKAKAARKRDSFHGSVTTDTSDASAAGSAQANAESSGESQYPPDVASRFAAVQNAQAQAALAMAGQGGTMPVPSNYGLWAAMAANQASVLQNQAMAAAAVNHVDPRVVMQMNAMMSLGAAGQGLGYSAAFGSSMLPNSIPSHATGFRSSVYQSGQDPPGTEASEIDSYGGGSSRSSSRKDNPDPE